MVAQVLVVVLLGLFCVTLVVSTATVLKRVADQAHGRIPT
jgi:hypothetical protein